MSLGEWGDANDQLIEYFVQQMPGTEDRLSENKRFLREMIVPELSTLYGVAQVDMFEIRLWWLSTTPFGGPVVPEV